MSAKDSPDALIAKYGKGAISGLPCTVGSSGKRELIEALRSKGVQMQRISLIMDQEFGIRVSGQALGRHLNLRCRCKR